MKEGNLFCFVVSHIEIYQTIVPLVMFLVQLESP
jgi:hypothetical protein